MPSEPAGDHHRHDREPVEAVRQVHRVGRADDHQHGEGHVEQARMDHRRVDDRHCDRALQLLAAGASSSTSRRSARSGTRATSRRRPGTPRCEYFATLRKSSAKPISPKPNVTSSTAQTKPLSSRAQSSDGREHRAEDQHASHRRRPGLLDDVPLRAVAADRLALLLHAAQPVDDRPAEEETEDQRREEGAAGAKGDVAEQVEEVAALAERGEQVITASGVLVGRERGVGHTAAERPDALDDPGHARAERALDHDDVARVNGFRNLGRQRGAVRAPERRASSRGSAACIAFMRGPQQCTRSIAAISGRSASAACRLSSPGPSSSMSPRKAIRRPRLKRPMSSVGLACREHRERRAHRGGIGVVALVEQRHRAVHAGGPERDRLAAATPAGRRPRRRAPPRRGRCRRRPPRRRPARRARSARSAGRACRS